MDTAKSINSGFLIGAILFAIITLSEKSGMELISILIPHAVLVGLLILAVKAKSLKNQKIFGIIALSLVIISFVYELASGNGGNPKDRL